MDNLAPLLVIVGRVLLGGYYVRGGLTHFTELGHLTQVMAAKGAPFPRASLIGGSLFQIACGAALMLGFQPFWAALGLVGFTVAASVIFMKFWAAEGEARTAAIGGWLTNLALIGGLLIAAGAGA
jgi:putative oxidoreductase